MSLVPRNRVGQELIRTGQATAAAITLNQLYNYIQAYRAGRVVAEDIYNAGVAVVRSGADAYNSGRRYLKSLGESKMPKRNRFTDGGPGSKNGGSGKRSRKYSNAKSYIYNSNVPTYNLNHRSGMPKSVTVRLKGVEYQIGATSTTPNVVNTRNFPLDPANMNLLGYSDWAAMYNKQRVVKVKAVVFIEHLGGDTLGSYLNQNMVLAVRGIRYLQTTASNVSNAMASPGTKFITVPSEINGAGS